MAAPFDKFPSLRTYLDWARNEAGCTVQEGVNGTCRVYMITAPSGAFIVEAAIPDDEGLHPLKVSNLDRRLGIESPFPKAPEPYS